MKVKLLFCFIAAIFAGNCDAVIIYPKAPDGGLLVVSNNVAALLRNHPDTLRGAKMDEVTIAKPFRLYFVGLTNLANGQLLPAVKSGGWQYLLLRGTNAVGAAGLAEKDGQLIFGGLYETDFSDETVEIVQNLKEFPEIRKQDYELRRLDVVSVSFVALWLHGKSDDIIIPLSPHHKGLRVSEPYRESDVVKALQPEAERLMKSPAVFN